MGPLEADRDATPVLDALKAGKWRKARDAAKVLCKRDPAKYGVLLIEANTGLFRQMLGRGQFGDAATVLAYLRTVAPGDLCATLDGELRAASCPAARDAPGDKAADDDTWGHLIAFAERLAAGAAPQPNDWLRADLWVARFQTPPPSQNSAMGERVAIELSAIHAACDATGEGRWDTAREALKSIPPDSVFRHWRMFLRGVRHWFLGESAPASRCFGSLPPGGAVARAALVIAGPEVAPSAPTSLATTPRAAWWLASVGQPSTWAPDIVQADVALRAGRWDQAFERMQRLLGKGFPTDRPGLKALWTDVFFPAHEPHESEATERMAKARNRFLDRAFNCHHPPVDLLCTVIRHDVLAYAEETPAKQLAQEWRQLLELQTHRHGPNPIRDAVGLHWLGTQLARKTPPLAFFGPAHQPLIRDAAGARQAFEDAVARDPDNEDAWLGLLALLDDTQQLSERNRLLDKLVARFPGNKTLLLQAGARAIERKAFGKAAKFLRQALALDPLDLLAKSTLVAALLRQTLENRNKDKSSPEVWDEIDLLVADRPPADPHMLGRWTVRLKRGLIDPDPAAAAHAMEEARRRAPSARERLFLERALVLGHDLPRRPEWDEEWAAAPPASWHELGAMLDVLVFATRLKHWAPRICHPCGALLEKTLADVLRRKLLPQDPPGALAFFRRLKNASPHAQSWPIPRIVADALRPKINAYLKKTPGAAPEIRLIHLELLAADGTLHPSQSVLNRLDRLIADATTARLTHVVDEARHLKKQLEQGMGAPRGFVPPFDDRFFDGPTDSDDKDFDEDWDDDAEDDWDQCAASLSIHAAEVLTGMTPQLACAILQGDNATILQLRRQAIAQGVPGVIFDRVVREGPDSIDRTQGRRGQTSGRSRRRSRKSSDTDYRQLDLFGP